MAFSASLLLMYVTYADADGPCWCGNWPRSAVRYGKVHGWYVSMKVKQRGKRQLPPLHRITSYLDSCVRCTRIDYNFMDLAVLSKVFVLFQDLGVGQSRRQPDDKDQVLLHHPHVRQVFPVFGDFRLPLLVPLPLLRLKRRNLLLRQGREVGRVLRVRLPARRAQLVLVGADPVPAEPADLVWAMKIENCDKYGIEY